VDRPDDALAWRHGFIFAGGALGTLARAALAEAVVTIVIDTPERIARAQEVIDELTSERGLVTCETITCLDEAGLRAQARR
jgi:16S rRNA C1402 (ribose-2'-O) methylase RsmI